jgi:hypothetical protein
MLEKDKLRKADVFSGAGMFLFGLWVVSQALKMPMKGSWGGVQNVWFVSPALFPLFVGAMIMLLGILLTRTALNAVGARQMGRVFRWLSSADLLLFLQSVPVVRFYLMVALFFSYVFLNIPRADFFLCSVLFLMVFISAFYFDDDQLLVKLFRFFVVVSCVQILFVAAGIGRILARVVPYPNDWFVLMFALAYWIYARTLIRRDAAMRQRFRTCLIVSIAAPFLIGPVFKYLLLVPMPTEGLVVMLMDAIRYWDF